MNIALEMIAAIERRADRTADARKRAALRELATELRLPVEAAQ